MSTTYLHRQKITLENGLITLHWATFDSNVSPQPGPGFGSRSSDFTVCAQVAASDQMAIRELFEEICREMDGGCLKHRREWINGGAAWDLWQTRLKRATGIELGRPRLSKIYWRGMPPCFFGKASPLPGLERIAEGEVLDATTIRSLIMADVSLPITIHTVQGERAGQIGFLKGDALCAYKPGSCRKGFYIDGEVRATRATTLGFKTYGHLIRPMEGVFAKASGGIHYVNESPVAFVLVTGDGDCVCRMGLDGAEVSRPGAHFRTLPFCFSIADAEDALVRVRRFIPEGTWALERADHFGARFFP
jgi:hypothetical protein